MSALTDSINTEVAALLPEIQAKQTAFAASHNGSFFQGIRTPEPVPKDGAEGVLDKTLHPTDQVENWLDFGLVLPSRLRWAIEILFYDGPKGRGYVVGAWVVEGIRTKLRRWNFGPEAERENDWVNTP